jgi:hypothetical protein
MKQRGQTASALLNRAPAFGLRVLEHRFTSASPKAPLKTGALQTLRDFRSGFPFPWSSLGSFRVKVDDDF